MLIFRDVFIIVMKIVQTKYKHNLNGLSGKKMQQKL